MTLANASFDRQFGAETVFMRASFASG